MKKEWTHLLCKHLLGYRETVGERGFTLTSEAGSSSLLMDSGSPMKKVAIAAPTREMAARVLPRLVPRGWQTAHLAKPSDLGYRQLATSLKGK